MNDDHRWRVTVKGDSRTDLGEVQQRGDGLTVNICNHHLSYWLVEYDSLVDRTKRNLKRLQAFNHTIVQGNHGDQNGACTVREHQIVSRLGGVI